MSKKCSHYFGQIMNRNMALVLRSAVGMTHVLRSGLVMAGHHNLYIIVSIDGIT